MHTARRDPSGGARTAEPLVSIVMPVFNGGRYLPLSLRSAIAQTYPNIEILVVDDGSSDPNEVAGIVAEAGSERVRVFRQENGGVASALNRAVAEMRGAFFSWLSHDDLFEPHKTERQVAFFHQLERPDVVLFSDFSLIDAAGNVLQDVSLDPLPLRDAPLNALMRGYINGCTIFAPADLMRCCAPFSLDLRYTQDYDMWHRLTDIADFIHQPERLVRYRVHAAQGTNTAAATLEAESLWIGLIDGRSSVQRAQLCGSSLSYFRTMALHLAQTPYRAAAYYAAARARRAIRETAVTAIVLDAWPFCESTAQLHDLLAQTLPPAEILLIGGSDELAPTLRDQIALDDRIRWIEPRHDGAAALARAIEESVGEYCVFFHSGMSFDRHWISQWVTDRQERGSPTRLLPEPEVGIFELEGSPNEDQATTRLSAHDRIIASPRPLIVHRMELYG